MYACFDRWNDDEERMIMGLCCVCGGEIKEFDDEGELVED